VDARCAAPTLRAIYAPDGLVGPAGPLGCKQINGLGESGKANLPMEFHEVLLGLYHLGATDGRQNLFSAGRAVVVEFCSRVSRRKEVCFLGTADLRPAGHGR
jgi:hypothetical protein